MTHQRKNQSGEGERRASFVPGRHAAGVGLERHLHVQLLRQGAILAVLLRSPSQEHAYYRTFSASSCRTPNARPEAVEDTAVPRTQVNVEGSKFGICFAAALGLLARVTPPFLCGLSTPLVCFLLCVRIYNGIVNDTLPQTCLLKCFCR